MADGIFAAGNTPAHRPEKGIRNSGAPARLNSPQEHPREGDADQERAWLAGLAWLGNLTPAERDAALATAATSAKTPGAEAPPLHAHPPKVKIDHADAEFGYSWFAVLSPDQRGACIDWFNSQAAPALAASATPAPAIDPPPLTIDGERKALLLEAAWQIDALVDTVLGLVEPSTKGIAITSIAARIRDLSDATLALVDDPDHSLPRLHRTVHGAFSEGEGEVS